MFCKSLCLVRRAYILASVFEFPCDFAAKLYAVVHTELWIFESAQ